MKQKIINRSFQVLGLASVIALGIGSILGSGGSSSGGGTPPASTPNTNFVVFMADKDTDGVTELYKYSLETGTTDKVNGALTTSGDGGDVTSFAISPNRQWIAYVADQDTNNTYELYVAPADGSSAPTKRSSTLVGGGDVSDNPVWAPDSSLIAFHSDGASNDVFILAVVAPSGAAGPVIVSGIGAVGANADVLVDSYQWAPDSSRIAYQADLDVDDVNELYTNLTDASDNRKINSALVAGKEITEYAWAPDSSKIVYRADQDTDETFNIYTSNPDGSVNTQVGGVTGVTTADVVASSVVWAPDSSRIAYIVDLSTDEIFELNTVLPDGTGRIVVSDGLTGQKDVVGTPSWAPNSSRVAFLADKNQNDEFELFTSVANTAGGSVRVNDDLAGGNVSTGPTQAAPPAWSPDSSTLIYAAEQDTAGVVEVYVRAVDGTGTSTKVSGAMAHPNGDASLSGDSESWSPNGARILYRADQNVDTREELFTSTSAGASNQILTRSPPATNDALKSFGKWAPNSSYVAYASTQDTGTAVVELFISTPGGTITNVSGTIAGSAGVNPSTFAWGP